MKKIITLLAVAAGVAIFTPTTSQARDYHGSCGRQAYHHCGSCGSAMYRERVVVGHDRYGRCIYSWRNVRHTCRSHYGHGHHHRGHGSYYRGGSRTHISFPGIHVDLGGRNCR